MQWKVKSMNKILIIDNFDSFVYNLAQYFGELGSKVIVERNNITLDKIDDIDPDKIVLSPGPGRPEDAGITSSIIIEYSGSLPILGICLGHQSIAYSFGGTICRANCILHGKQSVIYHNKKGIFSQIPSPIKGVRYHSLIVDRDGLPQNLEIIAHTKENEIMALKHKRHPIYGLQFHPESVLNEYGKNILQSFLEVKQ